MPGVQSVLWVYKNLCKPLSMRVSVQSIIGATLTFHGCKMLLAL